MTVSYLGVSGLLLEHQGHVLLTAPFFSNPRLGLVRPKLRRLLLTSPRISADTNAIEQLLPRNADHASVILVGHGHYDHLLDVPYIVTHRATSALIYGGPSVRHMLMGDPELRKESGQRLVVIRAEQAGTPDRAGEWIDTPDGAFRFMPVVADHAPMIHYLWESYRFAAGAVTNDLDSLPHTAQDWKLGEPYAFLIDVLERGTAKTVFRIFYQDAPSTPPLGFPPLPTLSEHAVDLAILCAATSSNVPDTPDSLLKVLRPAQVMVTHWESFFRSRAQPIEVNSASHLPDFFRSLNRTLVRPARWAIPMPKTIFRFTVHTPR